jgi:hypothetical protein
MSAKKSLASAPKFGHIMTMIVPEYLRLPIPNDQTSIERHRAAVFGYFNRFFDLADSALKDSIAKATDIFGLFEGPRDRAVHAMMTRYLVKVFLTANKIAAEEEYASTQDERQNGSLDLEWVPNCGVFVRLPEADIRILKASLSGVPKSTSTTRSRYYSSNQMLFAFGKNYRDKTVHADLPLTLVLLWDIDSEFNYSGLEVACPRTTRADGSVDCFWIEKWTGSEALSKAVANSPDGPESDLDEITPITRSEADATGKS